MRSGWLSLVCLLLAAPLAGQIRTLTGVDFSIGAPGGRAVGMGGAFIGLADDASATWTNPAGLTVLRKPELSIEFRSATIRQTVAASGDYPDVTFREVGISKATPAISHVAVVFPLREAAFAVYHRKTLAYRLDAELREPVRFYLGPDSPVSQTVCQLLGNHCTGGILPPESANVNVELSAFGVAAAKQFGQVSIGGGVMRIQSSVGGTLRQTAPNGVPVAVLDLRGDASDVAWNVGVKWTPSTAFSMGSVYAPHGAKVDNVRVGVTSLMGNFERTVTFRSPGFFGVGAALRPISTVTITGDIIWTNYSSLRRSYAEFSQLPQRTIDLPNGIEYHAGAEYFLPTKQSIAVRGGVWQQPAHVPAYRGPLTNPLEVSASVAFPPTDAETHWTAGFGMAWPTFLFDVAFDTSESGHFFSTWIVARF